jgi:CheY-like chemotaxis protein
MGEMSKRILVVDDEELSLFAARENLKQLGCFIDLTRTGEEALRLVARNSYQLILLDIDMFDMDGLNVAKRIKKMGGAIKEIPLVAVTARVYDSLKRRAKEIGFVDYVAKPLDVDKCRAILANIS